LNAPGFDEVEITLLGPGFGEAIVVHLGDGRWILIDSCLDTATKTPAALLYLDSIGVDPNTSVSHIIATHWHDDHVGACGSATFCCAAALTSDEFMELVTLFNKRTIAFSTGVSEIEKILYLLMKRQLQPKYVLGDMPILTLAATGQAPTARVTALSPVNAEYYRFVRSLARHVPTALTTKHRFPRPDENDISIAAVVTVGNVCALLGADLETKSSPERGWNAVLTSTNRPTEIATMFKVPHHGSATGHHHDVWTKMVAPQPVAILTPWNLGRKLPTRNDRSRIQSYADRSFITSRSPTGAKVRSYAVAKSIRESNITVTAAEPSTGRITARIALAASGGVSPQWSIDLSPQASDLRY
jgi:hypothetical protein